MDDILKSIQFIKDFFKAKAYNEDMFDLDSYDFSQSMVLL